MTGEHNRRGRTNKQWNRTVEQNNRTFHSSELWEQNSGAKQDRTVDQHRKREPKTNARKRLFLPLIMLLVCCIGTSPQISMIHSECVKIKYAQEKMLSSFPCVPHQSISGEKKRGKTRKSKRFLSGESQRVVVGEELIQLGHHQ